MDGVRKEEGRKERKETILKKANTNEEFFDDEGS